MLPHLAPTTMLPDVRGAPDTVQLTMRDLGVGFDPDVMVQGSGLGLTSMKERLKFVDGIVCIDSHPVTYQALDND